MSGSVDAPPAYPKPNCRVVRRGGALRACMDSAVAKKILQRCTRRLRQRHISRRYASPPPTLACTKNSYPSPPPTLACTKNTYPVGREFAATNGILQGCPVSVICLNALIAVWAKAVESEAPAVKTAAYADDKWMMALGSKRGDVTLALQKGATVSRDFAKLTGEKHNVKKTELIGTTADARKPIDIGGGVVRGKTNVKGVGVHLSAVRAKRSGTASARVTEAISVAARVRHLSPATFTEKAWLLAAAAAPKGLFGCAVTPYTRAQLASLRRAFAMALFPKHTRRCQEIVFTLMVQGHRIDPEQVVPYECLRLLWRMVDRRPDLRGPIERVWRERQQKAAQDAAGPIYRLECVAEQLGWQWISPWTFRDRRSGRSFCYARMPEQAWLHEVREAARRTAWREAEQRRKKFHDDFAGIGEGVDRAATTSLMAWKRLSGLERGYLRVVVAGGVYTQQRLFDMHKVKSPHCQHCGARTNEDQQHIWWDCPAWQAVRERHPDALAEYDPEWPACLRLNGVMPEAQYDAAEAQREQDAARGPALGKEERKDGGAVPAQKVTEPRQKETVRGTALDRRPEEKPSEAQAQSTAQGGTKVADDRRMQAGGPAGWRGPTPQWLFRALRPREEWRDEGLRPKCPEARIVPEQHILRTTEYTQFVSMTTDPQVALYFALRWAKTRPRVVRIRAESLDESALVDVRTAESAAEVGLSPAACAQTGGDNEILYAGAVPPEALDQPDQVMDDCSVLRVKWRKGLRK
eukprot:gene19103-biopygen11384